MSETDPHVASLSLVSVKTLESVWMQKEAKRRRGGGGGAGCEVQTVTVARTGRHIPVPRLDCSTTPLLARTGWGSSCRGTQVGGLYIGSRLERVRRGWLEEIHRGWRLEELHRGWGLICSVNAALREAGLMFP